ncbi:MAG: hypothetical protein AAF357_10825, partial [Verrucomicrobiota bacterium]
LEFGSLEELITSQTLRRVVLENPAAIISKASLESYRSESQASAPKKSREERIPWTITEGEILGGTLVWRGFENVPRIETRIDASLSDLQIGGARGFESGGDQTFELSNSRIWAPGVTVQTPPVIKFASGSVAGNYATFDRSSTIEKIHLSRPEIVVNDETLGQWLEPRQQTDFVGPPNRTVYRIDDLLLEEGRIDADTQIADGRVPKVSADFTLARNADAEDVHAYELVLTDLLLRNHARNLVPVAAAREEAAPATLFPKVGPPRLATPVRAEEVITVEQVNVDFTASRLFRDRRIDQIRVRGGILKVGEGLKSLATPGLAPPDDESDSEPEADGDPEASRPSEETEPAAPGEVASPTPPPLPIWTIDQLEITESRVRFEALIPEVEGLEFAINTALEEVPLSLQGILDQEKLQKVELTGIEIKDPYDSFITVAVLPTIFVEFSLGGLARQEIERIDLINPALHVGQGLFWWIEYQRKFRDQNEGARIGLEGEGPILDEGAADWVIREIKASSGKIVIAPKGIPLGMVPFPFNATTNFGGETFALDLTIPEEDFVYDFPNYKVKLIGLSGDVQFNVPVQEVDNNLVQVFRSKRVIWRKHEAEDLFLDVTFDASGVYGKFGGEAYDGYVEGQFNFYLEEESRWDAWISGTNLDTGPLTAQIVPCWSRRLEAGKA